MVRSLGPSVQQAKSIIDWVKSGDIDAVWMELERFKVDAKEIYYDNYKQTPLFYCTHIRDKAWRLDMVNFLIAQGVDPTYKDSMRQSALFYASWES